MVKHIFDLAEFGKTGKPWGINRIATFLNENGENRDGD